MVKGVARTHGAVPELEVAHLLTVAVGHSVLGDTGICCPKPEGSKRARAALNASVVADSSARTTTWMSASGSLPVIARCGLVAAMRGSFHRVMFERKMSARTRVVRVSAGSAEERAGRLHTGTMAVVSTGYMCRWGDTSCTSCERGPIVFAKSSSRGSSKSSSAHEIFHPILRQVACAELARK
eukprot:scaffold142999_cov33-Tisochrysis_lutea.AAC.2